MTRYHVRHDPLTEFAKKSLNLLFQARKRLGRIEGTEAADRSIEALEALFAQEFLPAGQGFFTHDPTGEKYSDTRTDVQASMSGEATNNLRIVETMKPIISLRATSPDGASTSIIVQQGVVVVRGSDTNATTP